MSGEIQDLVRKHNVNILGSGDRVMMFAHGLGLDQTTWRLIAPAFQQEFKVVLLDYIGCGKSNKSAFDAKKYSTLEGYADDVNNLCEYLHLKDVVFVAHSVSSMIGLIAALNRPAFYDKLIFIGPSPRYLNDVDGYIGGHQNADVDSIIKAIEDDCTSWVYANVPTIVGESNPSALVKEIVNSFISTDREMLKQFALATFFIDYRKELLRFNKPCLILQPTEDVIVPLQVGDYLEAHLCNGSLLRLKGKGHFPQLTSPTEVIAAISGFISE